MRSTSSPRFTHFFIIPLVKRLFFGYVTVLHLTDLAENGPAQTAVELCSDIQQYTTVYLLLQCRLGSPIYTQIQSTWFDML